jgi:hypothetical protein
MVPPNALDTYQHAYYQNAILDICHISETVRDRTETYVGQRAPYETQNLPRQS